MAGSAEYHRGMTALPFDFQSETLHALPSGGVFWPSRRLLCVADLHLGKSHRMARRTGALLPPYETGETLLRLAQDIATLAPATVICLGDSFDDLEAATALADPLKDQLLALMAGRRWVWVLGNHDPGPVDLGGSHLAEHRDGPLVFRHIAEPDPRGEVSGHYHPKLRLQLPGRSITRRCFLLDAARLILPAYGAYTGGLFCDRPELSGLMAPGAQAIAIAPDAAPVRLPMPR